MGRSRSPPPIDIEILDIPNYLSREVGPTRPG
jgi:hypothetical protein